MGEFDAIFEGIENAKPIASWTRNLGIGEHTVVLNGYRVKRSEKEFGNIVEADFVVLESSVHEENEERGWAWFIDAPGWTGKYNQARAKDFLKEAGKCVGDERSTKEIGADFVSKAQKGRGLTLKCRVTPVLDDAGKQRLRKNGEPITNAEWTAVPQSLTDIAELRAQLEGDSEPAPAPAPEPVKPEPAKKLGGGLKLGAKK